MTIPRSQADPTKNGGYRDRILQVQATPDDQRLLAVIRGSRITWPLQDVKGMQAPSDQAVTAGHGECCCSECETGWAAAWAEWVSR